MSFILLFVSFLLCSCSNKDLESNSECLFLKFSVIANGKLYNCVIDNDNCKIIIPEITDGNVISSVDYQLSTGADVYPEPESNIGNWTETESFVVSSKNSKRVYKVVLEDFVKSNISATIYLDEEFGRKTQHLFYDLKLSIRGLNSKDAAYQHFKVDGFDGVRIPIFGNGEKGEYTGHKGPGLDDVIHNHYKNLIVSVKNALNYNKDIIVFASKKLTGGTSFADWMRNGNTVITEKYVEMLISYLKYMKQNDITVHVLGIDNEPEYSKGNIDANKYFEIVSLLKKRIEEEKLYMPRFIAPERFSPQGFTDGTFMYELFNIDPTNSTMDIYGTHYYTRHHAYNSNQKLKTDVYAALSRGMEIWATEPHWNSYKSPDAAADMLGQAKMSMCTLFDQTDLGLDNIIWWEYPNSFDNLRGFLMRELTIAIFDSHPIRIIDHDGEPTLDNSMERYTTNWEGPYWQINNDPVFNMNMHSRAYIKENGEVNVFIINVKSSEEFREKYNDLSGPGNSYKDYVFNIENGLIDGDVEFIQWTDNYDYKGKHGILEKKNNNQFVIDIPVRSITKLTFKTKK